MKKPQNNHYVQPQQPFQKGDINSSNHTATLFIQMQLCPFSDLRTWLHRRRDGSIRQNEPKMKKESDSECSHPMQKQQHFLFDDSIVFGNGCDEGMEDDSGKIGTDTCAEIEVVDRFVCLKIFSQVVDALVHIHSQNVVHRDLKPDNVRAS